MPYLSRWLLGSLLAVLLLALGCASSEGTATQPTPDGGDTDTGNPMQGMTPTAVETVVAPTVRSGEVVQVTCLLRDQSGMMVAVPMGMSPTVNFAPMESVRRDGERTVAARAGRATAACAFPGLGLTDDSPAPFEVLPGAPARITTRLDRTTITAGESATATCEVTDAAGNPVPGAMPTLALDPSGEGQRIMGLRATVERSGMYTATCRLAGAMGDGVGLTVNPALPARLMMTRNPDRPVYPVGDGIDFERIVTDRYGNRVTDARAPLTSRPAGRAVSPDRIVYDTEGRYTVSTRVEGPTEGGVVLEAMTSFVVDSTGPAIRCTGDNTMIDGAVGSTITVRGTVTDTSGVRTVRVGGRTLTTNADGGWETTFTARWGVNFLDVSATDTLGMENSRTCAFLISDEWNAEDALLPSAVSLRLTQAAVGDGDPISPITSLDDILQTVVNSRGLRDSLHSALLAANPLKPEACDQDVCAFGRCVCLFRSGIRYLESELRGPHVTSLTLVDGGLRTQVRFNGVRIRLAISGTISNTGWVTFEYLDVGVTFDLSVSGGRPHAAVRPGSVAVTVGRIGTEFSGLTGLIVDIVSRLAQGFLRDTVSNLLRGYITDNFGRLLDGLVGGLDVSTLGANFNVPRLDGMGNVPLRFGLGLSALNASSSRALFGLGTRFSAMPVRATRSLGVALPPVSSSEPSLTTPATVALHPGLLNQALHTLWRASFFDARLSGDRFGGGMFRDATITLTTALPPVASLRADGRVNLDLAGLEATVALPLLSAPLRVGLGARASTSVTLMGNDLRFGGITLDEVHLNFENFSSGLMDRDMFVMAIRALLQNLVDRSLNDALPAIPIPGFRIADSLGTYGLPVGRELGITTPALAFSGGRFLLRGGFGVR